MKVFKIVSGFSILIAIIASPAYSQQQFTHTVTAANKYCNATCSTTNISSPFAILIVSPILVNGTNRNPHPIGVFYVDHLKKWSIINVDGVALTEGVKFNVQYYLDPDPNQFVFVVAKQGGTPCIDHAGLNGKPNAQVLFSPTGSPRGAYFNKHDAKIEYDPAARQWCIVNLNDQPVNQYTAFNIVVTAGAGPVANTTPTPSQTPPIGGTIVPNYPPPYSPNVTASPTPLGVATPTRTSATVPTKTAVPASSQGPRDWTLRPDRVPSIGPNAEIILFIHGMDSRAEEADDITKALFALKAGGIGSQPAPPTSNSSGPDLRNVPGLQQVLQKYEGCILERYETVIDMINRQLDPKLSSLATTSGLQDRDQIQCVAGNTCSRAFRSNTFDALKAQAAIGDASNFEARLKTIVPRDCFDCSKHLERHTKHVHCTMDCGGNQGFDVLHPERSIGICFETCKAGVDAERLLTDVISDIHLAVAAVSGGSPAQSPPGPSTIAANFSTVQFNSCPVPSEGCPEQCDNPDDFSQGSRKGVLPSQYFEPKIPVAMLDTTPPPGTIFNVPVARNIGSNEGRLNNDLRAAASDPRPLYSLGLAAYAFATNDPQMVNMATAFADLSVTGRRAFENFKAGGGPKEPYCQGLLSGRPPTLSEAAVLDGCGKALDRAYRVANFLRTGQAAETAAEKTKKSSERLALGWIAVSGEDDQPHRPVNVPSSDHPQYDLDVYVAAPLSQKAKTVKVRARYTIAQSQAVNPGSSGKNLVIISLDLPTSGYTDNIDYEDVSPLSEIGTVKWLPIPDFQATGRTPMLDFIETFIVRFAETLDTKVPVKSNFKAVMGGSLGGNMTFRLGRRPDTHWPKFIVWSPASIWYSMGEGPDPLKHFGPRSAYEGAEAALKNYRPGDRAAFFWQLG